MFDFKRDGRFGHVQLRTSVAAYKGSVELGRLAEKNVTSCRRVVSVVASVSYPLSLLPGSPAFLLSRKL
jgi:hypothetical protein